MDLLSFGKTGWGDELFYATLMTIAVAVTAMLIGFIFSLIFTPLKLSNNKIKVNVYSAGELVPPFGVFDAVSSGTADMYHSAEFYWGGKNKAYPFFAAVPFGMTAEEFNSWIYLGGGQQLWDELGSNYNLKHFVVGNTG